MVDAAKMVIIGKFIVLNAYIRKKRLKISELEKSREEGKEMKEEQRKEKTPIE